MKRKFLLVVLAIVVVAGVFWFFHGHASAPKGSNSKNAGQSSSPQTTTPGGFNKNQYSLSNPTSIWVIVNKQHPLNPKNYVPADLVVPNIPLRVPGNESMQVRQVTATALETMFTAAKAQSISLMLASGYRSY